MTMVPPWITVLGHTLRRPTAAFTDLSVDRGSLARRGFLGSEGSRRYTGTVRTRARARAREGTRGMEAAGKSQDRWRCAAWEAHCGGRRCGTWPGGWAGGYIRCVLAQAPAAALERERNQWVRTDLGPSARNRGDACCFCLFAEKTLFSGNYPSTILCAYCTTVS